MSNHKDRATRKLRILRRIGWRWIKRGRNVEHVGWLLKNYHLVRQVEIQESVRDRDLEIAMRAAGVIDLNKK